MPDRKLPEGFSKNEFRVWAERRKLFDQDEWAKAIDQKRLMLPAAEPWFRATSEQLDAIKDYPGALVAHDPKIGSLASVEPAKNPDPTGSLGYVGDPVRLVAKVSYEPGFLVVPFSADQLGTVRRETLRLFRWDELTSAFVRIDASDVDDESDYVWGQVAVPGVYTIIGLQSDPLLLAVLRATGAVADLAAGMKPEARQELLKNIGQALSNEALANTANDRGVLERLFAKGWNPPSAYWLDDDKQMKPEGGFAGFDPIDICPRMPWRGWPELPMPVLDFPVPGGFGGFGGFTVDFGWRNVGPRNIAGHSVDVIVDPTDGRRLYTSTAGGGLWVLDNVDAYPRRWWRPLTDQESSLSIQSTAVAPSDGRIIYYGDAMGRVMRSDDRGATWARTSATDHGLINRIIVHPTEPQLLYVASERGLWRSRDGGATWDSNTGLTTMYDGAVTDVVMDHASTATLFIGVRSVGLLRSATSGRRFDVVLPWSRADRPTGTEIRIALGRQRTATTRAVVTRFDQEVFVNRSGGRVGTTFTSRGKIGGSGYSSWCFAVGIDPFDDNIVLAGSQDLFRCDNAFDLLRDANWTKVAGYGTPTHADQWHVAFDPARHGVAYLANDAGVYRSADSGGTWSDTNFNLITAQIYATGVSGNLGITGMYHQGIVASTSLNMRDWQTIEGGSWEFAKVYGDPRRPYRFYVEAGNLHRRRWPNTGGSDFDINYGNFSVTSVAVDPRDTSRTLLASARNPGAVMRTLDADPSAPVWTAERGITLAMDVSVESVAFAPSTPGMAYAISSDGRVFRKLDVNSADAWTQTGQWARTGVKQIAVNALDSERIYAITGTEIAVSPNGGRDWNPIMGTGANVPPASLFQSIVAHPSNGTTLYLGATVGVFTTSDEGLSWYNYDLSTAGNLPNAGLEYLFIHRSYLYAALGGRGLWRRAV